MLFSMEIRRSDSLKLASDRQMVLGGTLNLNSSNNNFPDGSVSGCICGLEFMAWLKVTTWNIGTVIIITSYSG